MKILYISNPNSNLTRVWVNWFSKNGHQVAIIADNPLKIEWPNMTIFDLPGRFNLRFIRFYFWEIWTRQILRNWQPDILHAHRVSSAGWLGTFTNFHPFVVTAWGSDLLTHPKRSRIARTLADIVLRNADLITANSKTVLQQAIRFGGNPSCCNKISWGVDLNQFYPENANRLREELNLGNGPIVLSPRAVGSIYNTDVIIESIPIVLNQFPDVIYLFLNSENDPIYKSILQKRIDELGINKCIKWLPFQTTDRFIDFFRISTVVISIPSSDSIPTTVLEAFACGSPVIVSDLPAIKEIITNNINGIIIPINDYHALAQSTIEMLSNPLIRGSFARYNISWVNENANRATEMKKMEGLYYDLLK